MRLLLDTHVALWWSLGDTQLSSRGRDLIGDPANDVFVSVVSVWEIATKSALPRRQSIGVSAADASALFAEAGFTTIVVSEEHALAVERLERHHGDPFDRLLVAQALVETYRLVTHDRSLAAYGDHVLIV